MTQAGEVFLTIALFIIGFLFGMVQCLMNVDMTAHQQRAPPEPEPEQEPEPELIRPEWMSKYM